MDVALPPDLEDLVREKVETGLYRDESEVVAEALRLLDRIDRAPSARDKALRAALQQGFNEIEAGRYTVISDEEELRAFFDGL